MIERSVQMTAPITDGSGAAAPLPLEEALGWGRSALRPSIGGDAKREALFLLAGVLRISPGQLLLERNRILDQGERAAYGHRIGRRARGEPLQYIEGRAAFRDLSLRVDPSVLIPRPETEELVECVLRWSQGREALRALDIGTGSGAIAISLAVEGPFDSVVGVDISVEALNVAHENAAESGVEGRLDLRLGPFFGALRPSERFHVIASNPPYVALGEWESLPEEVREWEPHQSLFAGPTGLEVVGPIVDGAPRHLESAGLLALEVAPGIVDAVVERIRGRGIYLEPDVILDLAGRKRIVLAERK